MKNHTSIGSKQFKQRSKKKQFEKRREVLVAKEGKPKQVRSKCQPTEKEEATKKAWWNNVLSSLCCQGVIAAEHFYLLVQILLRPISHDALESEAMYLQGTPIPQSNISYSGLSEFTCEVLECLTRWLLSKTFSRGLQIGTWDSRGEQYRDYAYYLMFSIFNYYLESLSVINYCFQSSSWTVISVYTYIYIFSFFTHLDGFFTFD